MGRSCPLGGLIIQGWKRVGLCRQVASIAEEEEAQSFCVESLLLLRGKCRVSEVQFGIGEAALNEWEFFLFGISLIIVGPMYPFMVSRWCGKR